MFAQLLGPEIQALIQQKDFAALKEIFREWPPADMADLIADLPVEDQVVLFRILPHDLAGDTFEYLGRDAQKCLLKAMGKEDVVKVINEMSPDDRTALLEELPGSAVKELLRLLSPQELQVAQTLLGYPEKSVGRLMTPDFIAVKDDWTVEEVLDHIRDHGRDSETLNVVYVLDDRGKLIDDVRIREFLLQPLDAKVSDIRDRNFVALKVTDLEQDVVPIFRKYDRTVLPAVDSEGRLVGIVTVDDILDVAEKEATEDIQKIGGSEALDAPYLVIGIFSMIKKRAGWLALLFMGELLTSTAMTRFQDELEKLIVLGLFLPLIISSGGNSGSQATSLIIRSLALRDVQLRDWFRVLRREMTAGLVLGLVLATIGLVRIILWQKFGWADYSHGGKFSYMTVAWAVSCSLVGVVLWGSVMGAMLPFLLRAAKFDPAVCSAPLVATLVDVTGLVIYFEIARLMFRL